MACKEKTEIKFCGCGARLPMFARYEVCEDCMEDAQGDEDREPTEAELAALDSTADEPLSLSDSDSDDLELERVCSLSDYMDLVYPGL